MRISDWSSDVCSSDLEAHLHPQACRSLWESIKALPGQKLITTHSPFFVQNVPFKDIVVLRRDSAGPKASSIPRLTMAQVPHNAALAAEIAKLPEAVTWDAAKGAVVCSKTLSEDQIRGLIRCYTEADRQSYHAALRAMREASRLFITEEEISKLRSEEHTSELQSLMRNSYAV